MKTFLATFERYHNSEKPDYRELLDLADDLRPIAVAVANAISDEFGCYAEPLTCLVSVEEALKKLDTGADDRVTIELTDEEEDDEATVYIFTLIKKGHQIVLGEDDASDKYNLLWISVAPFVPDQEVVEVVATLTQEQLVATLLRTSAITHLAFPPEV